MIQEVKKGSINLNYHISSTLTGVWVVPATVKILPYFLNYCQNIVF